MKNKTQSDIELKIGQTIFEPFTIKSDLHSISESDALDVAKAVIQSQSDIKPIMNDWSKELDINKLNGELKINLTDIFLEQLKINNHEKRNQINK